MSLDPARLNEVVVHREALAMRTEIEMLRDELAKLITDRDYLTTVEVPTIYARYNLKLGALEYEAFVLECDVKRARRRLELSRAYANRNQPIELEVVDRTLEEEFRQWQEKIEEMKDDLNAAAALQETPTMSAEESREVHSLYRQLAKRLHPDLNPHVTDSERNLWLQVSDAYQMGDLTELRALSLLLDISPEHLDLCDPGLSVLDGLRIRRGDLRRHIERILAQIAEIKSNAPYTLEPLLNDEEKLEEYREEIRAKIARLKEELRRLKAEYDVLTVEDFFNRLPDNRDWPDVIGDV